MLRTFAVAVFGIMNNHLPIVNAFPAVVGKSPLLQQQQLQLHLQSHITKKKSLFNSLSNKVRNPTLISLSTSTTPITSIATNSVMINIDDNDTKHSQGKNNNYNNYNSNDLFYGCTTQQYENYDIVTVDLENDRDYPIYIGTDFTNEQGREHIQYILSKLKNTDCNTFVLIDTFSNDQSFSIIYNKNSGIVIEISYTQSKGTHRNE